MGHILVDRMLPMSDDNGAATQPFVAVHQHRMTVAWYERAASNGDVVARVRTGTIP